MPPTITVMLTDDHEVVRRGIAELISADKDIEVIGDFGDAASTLSALRDRTPDVAIVDVRLVEGNGIELCEAIKAAAPTVSVLMLTSFADDQALVDAAAAGASAYVLKQVRGNDILTTIHKVASGEVLLDPASIRLAKQRLRGGGQALIDQHTAQERRVLDLVGLGHPNRRIAQELGLAEKTVKNYITSLLMKLHMKSRTEAAVFAARLDERDRTKYE